MKDDDDEGGGKLESYESHVGHPRSNYQERGKVNFGSASSCPVHLFQLSGSELVLATVAIK